MKKSFLRFVIAVFTVAIVLSGFTACTPRANKLRVYNWGEYMDETVVESFEEWHKDTYGEKIKVEYVEFTSNEDILTELEVKGTDWDLACPSDYMIERLKNKNLLQKIDKSIIDISADDLVDDTLVSLLQTFDSGNEYCVPYIWGTFGILYNNTLVTADQKEKLNSWTALWDSEFDDKIFMKDQERDSYSVAEIYANREALETASNGFTDYTADAYQNLIKKIFTEFSNESIASAEAALKAQKKYIAKYESDDGKMDMQDGADRLGLFWSCDAGFAMNDSEVGGETIYGNKDLGYVVPKEGSNVWVDGWVIPKSAKNTVGANRFLKYLCTKEISKLNAQYAGAPSVNKEAMEELKAELIADEDGYFEGTYASTTHNGITYPSFKDMYIEMMFPSQDTLSRCAVMGDFGEHFENVNAMWQRVKQYQS